MNLLKVTTRKVMIVRVGDTVMTKKGRMENFWRSCTGTEYCAWIQLIIVNFGKNDQQKLSWTVLMYVTQILLQFFSIVSETLRQSKT